MLSDVFVILRVHNAFLARYVVCLYGDNTPTLALRLHFNVY